MRCQAKTPLFPGEKAGDGVMRFPKICERWMKWNK